MSEHWRKKWVSIFCETCRRRVSVYFPRLQVGAKWQCDPCLSGAAPSRKSQEKKYVQPNRYNPFLLPASFRGPDTSKYATARCEICGRGVSNTITMLRNSRKWLCARCIINPTPRVYVPFVRKPKVVRWSLPDPVPKSNEVTVPRAPPANGNVAVEATSIRNGDETNKISTSERIIID